MNKGSYVTTLKPLFEDTIEKISHAIINGTGYNIGDLFVMKTDDMEAISSLPTLSVKRWKVSPVDLFRGMVELSKLKKSSMEDYKIQGYYIKALLEDRTRLFIRDALYWLARSAPQRQAAGGSSNQTSEEYEVEPSTSGGFQRCHATPGSCVSRISCQPFGCYGHHKYCTRSLSSSLLQLSRGGHAGVHGYGLSKYTCWGWQKPSKSFFTALPEGFKFQWHRENAMDGQSECTSNVEIEEDNDDVEDQLMEGQFDQFAMAMAFNDYEMAEKALQEMGKEGVGVPQFVEFWEFCLKAFTVRAVSVWSVVDIGWQQFLALAVKLRIQGMEQAAMLDMLAQLRMSLGKAEEVACLLSESKEVVDKLGSDSAQPLFKRVLEHMGSKYTSLGKPEEALPYYQRSLKIQEELHGKDLEHLLSPAYSL
ncbi:unnamed protein product [Sphagnum troendelagicum]|uniref:Uncharacterized protein n=1 Tax=Sphagnum troendelagicum TaxID=128251 RepID=A0ABP0UID2_9BRYO